MPRDTRVAAIKALEKLRKSRVISLVLGDRQAQETRLAPDVLPLVARHLRAIGKGQARIDLFLYTTGGDIMAAFRLVPLIREYCDKFAVIVPFRCQSAGTLVALGADGIIMLPEGQLSPIDPSTNGPYNPMIPGAAMVPGVALQTLPVSVEEVIGYLNMARNVADIKGEAGLVSVFEKLTSDVRPVALGQVYRARTQIKMLSQKLLDLHMKGEDTTSLSASIIATLTEKLHSHDYLITRREAKEIGLKVELPEQDLENAIFNLYEAYETDLHLREPFNPIEALAGNPQVRLTNDRAILESTGRVDVFQTEAVFMATPQGVQGQVLRERWVQA